MSLVCDVLFYVHLPAMTWYVVHRGCQTGVFSSWEACHAQVNGFKGACYRGYKSKDEALAALGSDDNQIEIRRVDGHPNNRVSWKDVIILVQGVIIFILICIIFLVSTEPNVGGILILTTPHASADDTTKSAGNQS
jgi:hypothetical protein